MDLQNERYPMTCADSTGTGLGDDEPDPSIAVAALTNACVLITGRPDTARDVAYSIHSLSGWRHGPFVTLDGNSSAEIIEAELFKSESVHHADATSSPRLRPSQNGTLFIREIGEMNPDAQLRLAERLAALALEGPASRLRRRLIASSAGPLLDRVKAGEFDERLYQRLSTINIVVPRRPGL